MKNITIRAADPDQDYEQVAALIQTFERQTVTADTIREWDKRAGEANLRRRMVGVDAAGNVVGYGSVVHDTWMSPEKFLVWVIADPALRSQGIGTALYEEAYAFVMENKAGWLGAEVLDNDPIGLGFAERRGFKQERHIFESTLDLHSFEPDHFTAETERATAQGIRIFSLAEAGNTEAALYKLWQVNHATALDDPGSGGSFPDFEEFKKIITGAWFRPDGQILAADGDTYVGLSAVGYFKDDNSAYQMMTGVMASYRGKGIAQALKVRAIQTAMGWGADYIRTNNDSQNAPMLAINRKLGYVPQPGIYRLGKTV